MLIIVFLYKLDHNILVAIAFAASNEEGTIETSSSSTKRQDMICNLVLIIRLEIDVWNNFFFDEGLNVS
jgi:hypothetical protein